MLLPPPHPMVRLKTSNLYKMCTCCLLMIWRLWCLSRSGFQGPTNCADPGGRSRHRAQGRRGRGVRGVRGVRGWSYCLFSLSLSPLSLFCLFLLLLYWPVTQRLMVAVPRPCPPRQWPNSGARPSVRWRIELKITVERVGRSHTPCLPPSLPSPLTPYPHLLDLACPIFSPVPLTIIGVVARRTRDWVDSRASSSGTSLPS